MYFNGKFSASARWAASGELATFRSESLPPNRLGTLSRARGLQRPTGIEGRILSRLRFKMVGGFAQAQPGLPGDGGNGAAGEFHLRVEAGSHRRAAERQLTQMRTDTRAR